MIYYLRITFMLVTILSISQFVLAILLMAAVLLQQKGAGLGATFGGASNVYTTRRGIDKVLFQATIVISVLFFVVSIATVLL